MNVYLHDLREVVWPLLEKANVKENRSPEENMPIENTVAVKLDPANLDAALQQCFKIADGEEDRRKGIETKSALLISTSSTASTILLAASTLLANQKQENYTLTQTLIVLCFFLVVYAVRTVWFATKALTRQSLHIITYADVNILGNPEDYKKALMKNIIEVSQRNNEVINHKMDNLVMAQEYFKRLLGAIVIYALLILAFSIAGNFISKNQKPDSSVAPRKTSIIKPAQQPIHPIDSSRIR